MARKTTDTAQLKLRIREDLRRRLEQAAKKRDVSLNFEMTDRLRASFDQQAHQTLEEATSRAADLFERYARETEIEGLQEDLMTAAEHLIKQLPAEARELKAVKAAVDQVQEVIKITAAKFGRMSAHEPWE